jgi:plasmid stabilization system protein ParE
MRFIVRPAAAAEMDEAFLWYEGQRTGVRNEVLLAVQATIDAIAEHPHRYPVGRRNTRRAPSDDFHRLPVLGPRTRGARVP